MILSRFAGDEQKLDDILNQSISNKKELHDFLRSDFQTNLNFFDIETAKIQFLTQKIVNKEEPYTSYFENLLKEILLKYDIIDDTDYEKRFNILGNKILNEDELGDIERILEYFYLKKFKTSFKNFAPPILNYINKTLKVDNILEEKLYLKYKNRRIKEICEYLNISENQLSDTFYYALSNISIKQTISNKSEFKDIISSNNDFNKNLSHLIKVDSEIEKQCPNLNKDALVRITSSVYYQLNSIDLRNLPIDKKIFDCLFVESLDEVLIINLRNKIMFDKEHRIWDISMITRLAEIDNIEMLLTLLSESIYTNYLRLYIKFLVNDLFDNYDKKDKTSNNTQEFIFEKTLDEKNLEINQLKKELDNLNANNNKLLQQLDESKKQIDNIKKDISSSYKKEISSLNKNIQNLTKQVETLKEDNLELNEIRKTLLSLEDDKQDEFDFSKLDLNQFKEMRYIFIGGRFELLKKLESIFPKGKFYHMKPQDTIDVSKTDKIIIFPKNINHPMYWDAINLAKKNNIPFLFTLGTNLETVMKDIVNDLN